MSSTFEFFQLRCFVAVAEELNFRRAAERMNMTQPPLSRQIRQLEHRIGVALFKRSTRQVQLTAAGETFFGQAVEILQRAEFAVLSARQAEGGEIGSVAMGFVPSAALELVPRIIAALAADLPRVTVIPMERMSYEILEDLRSGRLDFALTRMPGIRSDQITSQLAVSEPFVLAVPQPFALAKQDPVMAGDLNGIPFIAYSRERGGFLHEVQTGLFATLGVAPQIKLEVSQTHTMLALVNRGIGVALVPRSSSVMQMPNLVFREIALPERFRSELYLATGPKRSVSVLHTRVMEVIWRELKSSAPA